MKVEATFSFPDSAIVERRDGRTWFKTASNPLFGSDEVCDAGKILGGSVCSLYAPNAPSPQDKKILDNVAAVLHYLEELTTMDEDDLFDTNIGMGSVQILTAVNAIRNKTGIK